MFGLSEARVPDLELIVTELVTNSLRHPGGSCRVELWPADGHLCCAVHDDGFLADPPGGRGLLLVHQLADLVRTYTQPGRTTRYALLRL